MKICISNQSVEDFVKFFNAQAEILNKNNKGLTREQVYKSIYNAALKASGDTNSQQNKEVVLQHLLFLPIALNGKLNNSYPELSDDLAKTLKAMKNPSLVSSLIESYQKLLENKTSFEEIEIPVEPKVVVYEDVFYAKHLNVLTNQGGEYTGTNLVVNEDKVEAFSFIREMVRLVQDEATDLKIRALRFSQLKTLASNNKFEIDTSLIKTEGAMMNDNVLVFVVIDAEGNVKVINGKTAPFKSHSVSKVSDLYEGAYKADPATFTFKKLEHIEAVKGITEQLQIANKSLSAKEAENQAKRIIHAEIEQLIAIHKAVKDIADGKGGSRDSKVILDFNLNTTNFGYVLFNSGVATNLSDVFEIGKFDISPILVKDSKGELVARGFAVSGNGLRDTRVKLNPKFLDTDMELVENLIRIITDDSLTFEGEKLTVEDKIALVGKYVNLASDSYLKMDSKGKVTVLNSEGTFVEFNISDSGLADALRNYFTKFSVNEVVASAGDREVVDSLDGVTNKAQLYRIGSEQYSVTKPSFSLSIKPESVISIENNAIVLTTISDKQHIINNSFITAQVNDKKELRVYHPRIGFKFNSIETPGEKPAETTPSDNPTETPVAPVNVIFDSSVSDEGDFADGLFASGITLEKSSLLAEQTALNWFYNSPLAGVLKLDISDKKHPHALAQWFSSGITLYKGSNNTLLYHEAWHAFTQGILSKQQKAELYAEAKKNYKELNGKSDKDVEEFLAEKFRAFAMNNLLPKGSKLAQFFKNLFESLTKLFKGKTLSDDYFDQLVSGKFDIASYNPQENMYWGSLNSNIIAYSENPKLASLSAAQSKLILDTVNVFVNEKYAEKLKNKYFKIKSVGDLTEFYGYALKKIKELLVDQKKKQEVLLNKVNLNATEKMELAMLSQQVEALEFASYEMGDMVAIEKNISSSSQNKGIIGAHLAKGDFVNEKTINKILNQDDSKNEEDPFRERKDISLEEYADEEILLLLGTVQDFDVNGEPIKNSLGVTVLANRVKVLMKTGKALMGLSGLDEMVDVLKNTNDPMLKEVLSRMPTDDKGNPSPGLSSQLLWSKFTQTFMKSYIPLKQMLFERMINEDGAFIQPKYGSVSGSNKQVDIDLKSAFESSAFIETDIHGKYLNVKAALDYINSNPDLSIAQKFNAIGILVTDNELVNKALGSKKILSLFLEKLETAVDINSTDPEKRIKTLSDLIKSYQIEDNSSTSSLDPALRPLIKKIGLNTQFNFVKEFEFLYSDNYNSMMGTTADGERASELVLNSSATHLTNGLNKSMDLKELVKDPAFEHLDGKVDPFKRGNRWLNEMFDSDGKRRVNSAGPVKIVHDNLSGTKYFQEVLDDQGFATIYEKGLSNMDLDSNSKFITDVYLSFFGKSEAPRMADKSSSFHYGLFKGKFEPTISADRVKDPGVAMYVALKGYLAAEIVRINTLKTATGNIDKAYKKRGSEFFIFDGLLTKASMAELKKIESTDYDTVMKALAPHAKVLVGEINQYFKSKTETTYRAKQKDFYVPESMYKTLNTTSKKEATQVLIGMYERNKFIDMLDFTTLYLGDPAIYNISKEDFHKRIAGVISTGESFRHDSSMLNHFNQANNKSRGFAAAQQAAGNIKIVDEFRSYDGTINTGVIQDAEVVSEYLGELEKVIPGALAPYKNMNEADGQGFISFDYYRMLSISQGLWSPTKEGMYLQITNNQPYDQTRVKEFFQSMKLQYYGPVKSGTLGAVAFHKFNLVPLIPTMIKGTKLEVLHNKMMEQGMDYVTFESGSKLSTVSKSDSEGNSDLFYDGKTREINTGLVFTKNIIHVKYLKSQIKIHDHFTEKITLPTQMRTVLYAGLMDSGIPTDSKIQYTVDSWEALSENEKINASDNYKWISKYERTLSEISDLKRQELYDELGIANESDILSKSEKLAELIRAELTRNEVDEAQIDFVFNNNNLKSDISFAHTAGQIESMLVSLIEKRMTKIKVNGEGLIQMASSMTETSDPQWVKPTGEQLLEYGTNGLRSYYTKDGKIQAMEVKIALQGSFEKLLYINGKDGKPISVYIEKTTPAGDKITVLDYDATLKKLNDLLKDKQWRSENKELIRMTTARIPSQAMNSLEFMEVKEFLPKSSGNLIIVPSEIVAKAGSDYDVDKLFTLMPSLAVYNGVASLIKKTKKEDLGALKQELSSLKKKNASQKEIDAVQKRIDGQSVKGLENQLINVIIERLELLSNFKDLVQPNDTSMVEPLAKELEERVAEFDKFSVVHDETRTQVDKNGNSKNIIASSMIFDPAYNINKQIENSVGMDTLGIGAIINKYYSLFTRIGMYTNIDTEGLTYDEYLKITNANTKFVTKQQKDAAFNYINYGLHFENHNTKIVNGKKVTDLGKLYNSAGEYIPDILGQMINGWVDVAKSGWIFNIQGNKEAAPTLLYLIMAGVSTREAVMFVSSPIIREYLENKRFQKGALSVLTDPKVNDPKVINVLEKKKDLDAYQLTVSNLDAKFKKELDYKSFIPVLKKVTNNPSLINSQQIENVVMNGEKMSTDQQLDLLNKFVMYETLANQVTALTMSTKFDTKASNSLSEIREKEDKLNNLTEDNKSMPPNIVETIAKHSSLGMFNSNKMVLNLFSKFSFIKNNSALIKLAAKSKFEALDLGIQPDKHAEMYQDDFIWYLYQNEHNRITDNQYDGVTLIADESIEKFELNGTEFKYNPVFLNSLLIKKGTDAAVLLKFKFDSKNDALKYLVQVAKNKGTVFSSDDVHYIIAKKALKDIYNIDESTLEEKNVEPFEYEEEIQDAARDSLALLSTGSRPNLMQGAYSYAKRYITLIEKYPELKGKFNLLRDIRFNYSSGSDNIYLANMKVTGYSKIYREELEILKVYPNADVSEFFSQFDRFSVLQSGVRQGGTYNMLSITDPAHIENVIGNEKESIVTTLRQLSDGQIVDHSLLNVYNKLYVGVNFKVALSIRKKGGSFESDAYFDNNFQLAIDDDVLDLALLPGTKKINTLISQRSNVAMVFPTANKNSESDKQFTFLNESFPNIVNSGFENNDSIYVTGLSLEESNDKEIESLFNAKYKPVLDEAILSSNVSFNLVGLEGIETKAIAYLKTKGFTQHIILSQNGAYYTMSKEKSLPVDGLYSTGEVISIVNGSALSSTFPFKNGLTQKGLSFNTVDSAITHYSKGRESEGPDFYEKLYLFVVKTFAEKNKGFLDQLKETGDSLLMQSPVNDKFNNMYNRALMQVRASTVTAKLPVKVIVSEEKESINNKPSYSELINHSGGAYGGDTFWDIIGREFGVVNHKHYKDAGNANLSQKLKNSGVVATILTEDQMDFARQEVQKLLGITYANDLKGNLQVRNFYQVYNSDAVFAIATLKDTKSVTGGTNTAIQLGIKLNKPVYVWDIKSEQWYQYGSNGFEKSSTPTLTKNFAGIGSRDIENYNTQQDGQWKPRKEYVGDEKSNKAKQAIRDVYRAIASETNSQSDQTELLNNSKVIFGHPGIGKTFLKESGNTDIIDFDSDYKTKINKKFNLEEGFKARNDFQKSNAEDYKKEVRSLWEEAKQDAKRNNKKLLASDMILLREFSNDFDLVINMSKDTFIGRAKLRNDYTESTEQWKNNLDVEINKIDKSKVITTDKYLSDLFQSSKTVSTEAKETINVSALKKGTKKIGYTLFNKKTNENQTKTGYKITVPEFPNVELYLTKEHYNSEGNVAAKNWFIEVNTKDGVYTIPTAGASTQKQVLEKFADDINTKYSKSEHGLKVLKSIGIDLTNTDNKTNSQSDKLVSTQKESSVEREYTPENITSLKPNEVFVFGANTVGGHGGGTAGLAQRGTASSNYTALPIGTKGKWSEYGIVDKLMQGTEGKSFGIVTKSGSISGDSLKIGSKRSVSLSRIEQSINALILEANNNPGLKFLVTKFGTNMAGFTEQEMKSLLENKNLPDNIVLPKEFEVRNENSTNSQSDETVIDGPGLIVVNEKFGVAVATSNPTTEFTENLVQLIQPNIANAYRENGSSTANLMFSYGYQWKGNNTKFPFKPGTKLKVKPARINFNGDGKTYVETNSQYFYDSHYNDGTPVPSMSQIKFLTDHIQKTTGIDMSDYDVALNNIYRKNESVFRHTDIDESDEARNYPVVVYVLGNEHNVRVANPEDGSRAMGEIVNPVNIGLGNGEIYTFGLNGKGRFEAVHDTVKSIEKSIEFPEITLPDGTKTKNYTISFTFRRAADLNGAPISPKIIDITSDQSGQKYDNGTIGC